MKKKRTSLTFKLLVTAAFLIMIAANALAELLPINGMTTGDVNDRYPNLFTPAPITFAIWIVIYLLLAAYVLYQWGLFQGKEPHDNRELLVKTGLLFVLTCLLNTGWIFAWHYLKIGLSLLLMILLLLCLARIAVILRSASLSTRDKIFVRLPFSIYFGWITVAIIANVTVFLVSKNWAGFGLSQTAWTVIALALGALIGSATILSLRDIPYGLTLIWAYVGILIRHTAAWGFMSRYPAVVLTTKLCLALFVLMIGNLLLRPGGPGRPQSR